MDRERKQPHKDLEEKLFRERDQQVKTLSQEQAWQGSKTEDHLAGEKWTRGDKGRGDGGCWTGSDLVGLPKPWKGDRILF